MQPAEQRLKPSLVKYGRMALVHGLAFVCRQCECECGVGVSVV